MESTPYYATTTPLTSTIDSPLPILALDTVEENSGETSAIDPQQRLSKSDLQVYTRRSTQTTEPVVFAPLPVTSQSSGTDPTTDLPIAHRKGTRSCTRFPISNYVSYANLSSSFRAFAKSLSSITIPFNLSHALSHPGWRLAMEEEMGIIWANDTWDLVKPPPESLQLDVVGFIQ